MNRKTKALTLVIVSVVAALMVCLPLTQAESGISLGDELTVAEIETFKPENVRFGARVRFAVWFLRNAEATEVTGTVVALSDKKLILITQTDQIRVNLPAEWTVEGSIVSREELLTSGYLAEGAAVTVKALGADVDNDQVRIYVLVGYELVNEQGIKATANLRVNIED